MAARIHLTLLAAALLWGIAAAAAVQPDQLAAAGDASDVPLDVFQGPRSVEMKQPRYPLVRQRQSREGWVRLNFMISAEGEPYEIAVVDSTGDPLFERAAVEAVQGSTFAPASLDGVPTDAGYSVSYQFAIEGGVNSARRSFVSKYRRLREAVQAEDRETAEAILDEMDVRNLYENAFYQMGRFMHATAWGTSAEQLSALRGAVAYEGDGPYLPDDLHQQALEWLFYLQFQTRAFADALSTRERLEAFDLEDETATALETAVAEIQALRDGDRSYEVAGEVGRDASWFYRLLKNRFRIDAVDGQVSKLKLRCDRKYVLFDHDPEVVYEISDRYGLCWLQVVGDPGTTFRLVAS